MCEKQKSAANFLYAMKKKIGSYFMNIKLLFFQTTTSNCYYESSENSVSLNV